MSETPDAATEEFDGIEDELPDALPSEAPEADVIEQARGVRTDPETAGGARMPGPTSPTDEADEADRQEQAEVVDFDEDDETR